MDSPVTFPSFKWAQYGTNDYFNAIDKINEMYRKMLTIGEAKKVFRDKVCPMMTAKTKDKFNKARRSLNVKYWKYTRTSKATLPKLSDDVAFVPDHASIMAHLGNGCLCSEKSLQRKGSLSSSITWKLSICSCAPSAESATLSPRQSLTS